MEYRYLGRSGLQVSALSFGAWVTFGQQIDEDIAYECMEAAYEAGVNFFDNAEVYANGKAEIMMGNVIRKAGWKRSELVISTKLFWGGKGVNDKGLSRKHIIEGMKNSLNRLQLDYVDLIYCHRPDIFTPMEEIVRAMNFLIQNGSAFYWGTSEWNARQIMEAYSVSRREHLIPPLMEQPEYNMFERNKVEAEFLPLYSEIGLGITSFSPLASGLLTGKHSGDLKEGTRVFLKGYQWLKDEFENEIGQQRRRVVDKLKPIAVELGCSMAQMGLAWCLRNPHVNSVITGASKPEQVVENMQALEIMPKLTDEVMQRIDTILGNKPGPEESFR
jgi:voltage-dependent potassium channel beta subunit